MQEISVKECISYGWTTFKTRSWFFIGTSAVLFLASIIVNIPESLTESKDHHFSLMAVIGSLVTIALTFLVSMAKTGFYLRAHDDAATAELKDVWHPRPYIAFAIASILVGVLTILGLILLIVPGIIIGVALSFTLYLVMDKKMGAIAAMKESMRLTRGNRWNLVLLGGAILGINLLGLLALFVGLLVSIPITTLAVVHAYRTLSAPSVAPALEDHMSADAPMTDKEETTTPIIG